MPKHPGADVRLPGRELTRRQAVLALSRPVLARLGIGPWLTASATASAAAQSAANFPGAQLAWPWPPQRSPQGFLVSEKWDGVRALWDGQVLRFRSGRDLVAPAWFLAALPGVPLDGELWTGRGQFDRVCSYLALGPQEGASVALGGAAIGYRIWAPLSLLVQFNGHTALHKDSSLNALDRPGGQLSFGGRIDIAPKLQLDLGVQEDVLVSSSPDFSIHVGLRYR